MASDPPSKRGRGRPRREGADEEILSMALQMLRERGYGELTVDAVAERTGVAKTTVYRRWPSKAALIAAAVAPLVARPAPVPTGSLEADLTNLLSDIRSLLAGELGPIAANLIAEAQNDPEIAGIIRTAIAPRRALMSDVIVAAIARGEIAGELDVDLIIDVLFGPLWTRLLVSQEELGPDLAERIVRVVIHGTKRA
jgi:AcrR family transcriptional regulator